MYRDETVGWLTDKYPPMNSAFEKGSNRTQTARRNGLLKMTRLGEFTLMPISPLSRSLIPWTMLLSRVVKGKVANGNGSEIVALLLPFGVAFRGIFLMVAIRVDFVSGD